MKRSESWKYVSISFNVEFYFKHHMQNYLQCLENILARNY